MEPQIPLPTVPIVPQSPAPPAQPPGQLPSSSPDMSESLQQPARPGLAQPQPPAAVQQSTYENIYTEICTEIIKAQGQIMGLDLALEQAQGIEGLTVDPQTLRSTVLGDGSRVINDLIQRYKNFFGYAAVAVCREASARLLTHLSPEQTPQLLNESRA